jgi:hypothetical protein
MYKDLEVLRTAIVCRLPHHPIEVHARIHIDRSVVRDRPGQNRIRTPATAKTSATIDPASRFWP